MAGAGGWDACWKEGERGWRRNALLLLFSSLLLISAQTACSSLGRLGMSAYPLEGRNGRPGDWREEEGRGG